MAISKRMFFPIPIYKGSTRSLEEKTISINKALHRITTVDGTIPQENRTCFDLFYAQSSNLKFDLLSGHGH